MFGLGLPEILILLVLGGLLVGGAVAVAFLVVRSGGRNGRVAELEAENRRLRDELGGKGEKG